ncbi:rhomboid domain-containing protein 2 [Cyprinodon tularosa]|uniref:rhomboid domain-containing protein 2 n=1 Tax=Cyprinodon tularosa TaxID=77115 RepID=UPI0018E1E7EA|nr:rhomboid domain-containing protein 2 [Cyprinodon tularosa]
MQTNNFNEIFGVLKDFVPPVSSGTLVVVLCSCVWFGIQTSLSLPQDSLSIGASVFQRGHIHRLFLYPFQNRSLPQLLLSSTALLFLCAGVEKGFGTVRFLFLVFLLASFTGVFYSFLDLLQDASVHTEGLLPVILACVALTTLHTKMSKAFLCGISFPAVAIPWVLLIICTALIPHSVLLCNVIAILIGWVYGKGWLSYLDLSESRAAVLEKILPFKILRRISGAMFVPASSQKRKTLLPRINPTPGSYPVQAYAPLPSISTTATPDTMFEGWPNSVGFKPPHSLHGQVSAQNVGHNHGHFSAQNIGHNHGHFSAQNVGHSHGHFSAQNIGHNHGHFSAQNVGHSHGHFLDQSMGHSCNHNHGHSHGPEQ